MLNRFHSPSYPYYTSRLLQLTLEQREYRMLVSRAHTTYYAT
jgi:hypothetical protein